MNENMILEIKKYKVKYYKDEKWRFYPDINIMAGEGCCLIGKTGCGKTTLLNSLFSPFFKGTIDYEKAELLGKDIKFWEGSIFKEISYMPQFIQNGLNPALSINQQLRFIKESNISIGDETMKKYMNELELDEGIKKLYPAQISGGMRQRVGLLMGFIKKPKLFILDEPTSAIDYITLEKIINFLSSRKKEGCSILMVSHHMGFAEALADKIIEI